MLCPNCSKWLPGDTPYCDGCGHDFQPATSEGTNEKYPHPYHMLGGWLAFFAYSQMVALVLAGISILTSLSRSLSLIPLLRSIDNSMATSFVFATVMSVVHIVVIAFLTIKYFLMIKNKDARFFRYFEIEAIFGVCMSVAMLIVLRDFGVGSRVGSLILGVIGIFLWFNYFSNSVRVRTYFGSDEYLRRSIFLKNVRSPEPADTRPYTTHM